MGCAIFEHVVRPANEKEIGDRIGQARELAGLSQGELASQVSMSRSAMNKIENGGRRVTAFELSEIARVLNRRMEWFLTEPTPAIVSHREREGTSRRAIDAALELLTREVGFVASVGGKLALRDHPPTTVPTTPAEAEKLAGQVRSELGLGDGPTGSAGTGQLILPCSSVLQPTNSGSPGAVETEGSVRSWPWQV